MAATLRSTSTHAEALGAAALRPGRRYAAMPVELRATFARLRAQIVARARSARPPTQPGTRRHDDV